MASKNSYDASKPELQAILQLLYGFVIAFLFYCCIQKVPIKTFLPVLVVLMAAVVLVALINGTASAGRVLVECW